MTQDFLSNPRFRRLGFGVFLVVSSIAAGYGVYQGKLKILAILGLFTLGFLLRQGSVRNAYWLMITCFQLSISWIGPLRDEFGEDRWIALGAMAALSVAIVAFLAAEQTWPSLLHVLALALLVFALASSAWSPDGQLTFYKACSVGLAYMVAFLGAWSYGTNVKRVRSLADVHVDMLWIVFPLALFWYFAGMPNALLAGRLESIFENPNAIGVWCSMGLPLAAAFGLTHPVRWRRRACWFLLVTGLMAGLLSGSRGGVMGAFLGFGLYAGMRWRRWTLVLTAAAAVAGVFMVLYGVDILSHSSTLQTLVRPESLEGLSDRRYWWSVGTLIARQKPYLGHGFGIGESLFVSYGLDTSQGVFPYTIHNSYLETWMELGLLGVGLLVACQAWTVYLGLRTYRRDPDGEVGLLALALTCSAVSVSAHAFVEGILLGTGNPWMVPYWVTLALVARLHRIQRDEAIARQRVLARQPVIPRWGPLPTAR